MTCYNPVRQTFLVQINMASQIICLKNPLKKLIWENICRFEFTQNSQPHLYKSQDYGSSCPVYRWGTKTLKTSRDKMFKICHTSCDIALQTLDVRYKITFSENFATIRLGEKNRKLQIPEDFLQTNKNKIFYF